MRMGTRLKELDFFSTLGDDYYHFLSFPEDVILLRFVDVGFKWSLASSWPSMLPPPKRYSRSWWTIEPHFLAISRTHDLLAKAVEAQVTGKPETPLTAERLRGNTGSTLAMTNTDNTVTVPKYANFSIEEDSDTDDDGSLFV